MQTMIHGNSALQTSACVSAVLSMSFGAVIVAADSSLPRNAGDSQSSFGCQTLRNRMRQPIEISDAPISTIQGLMEFEITNCGIANDTPVPKMTHQSSSMHFQPT